jgi:TRAP-type uncharacterized transport system fused permease subunit
MTVATAAIGIFALAAGVQSWFLRATTGIERWLLIAAGLLLVYPTATADFIGLALFLAAGAMQFMRRLPQPA